MGTDDLFHKRKARLAESHRREKAKRAPLRARGDAMIDYMKRHERYVGEMLEKNLIREAWQDLLAYHDQQIRWMQHERLVHLMIMLSVCLFALLSLGFVVLAPTLPFFILLALLIILSSAYIFHYYRLENGVQKWYELSGEIRTASAVMEEIT